MALAIITVFSLTFISCGGDDDDDVVNKKPIMLYVGEETSVPETTNLESENNFVAFATSNNKIKNVKALAQNNIKILLGINGFTFNSLPIVKC